MVPRRPFLIMSPSARPSGLADDAVVELLAARLELLADDDGAVDAGPSSSLVIRKASDEGFGLGGQEFLDRHEGRDRGLHVGGAAAVQLAVAVRGRERVAGPLVERAGGHHVGVAGEHQRLAGRWRPDGAWPRGWSRGSRRAADDGFAA
jgi:hypothetical protein